jgi:hypothetical protein
MSAKKAKRSHPAPASTAAPTPATSGTAAAATTATDVAWIDSPDPKKRQWGKLILIAVWIYVAALWLLALDQWFHWGIFGPKTPIVP